MKQKRLLSMVLKQRNLGKASFSVQRVIGKGSFGTVHAAQVKGCSKWLALKECKTEGMSPRLLSHLYREFQMLRRVSSSASGKEASFIVLLQASFYEKKTVFFVIDFMAGGDLIFHKHKSKEKRLTEEQTQFCIACVILALSHLHTNVGMLHRDIKPANVLVDESGYCRIADFGLSFPFEKEFECSPSCPKSGTLHYLSPEAYRAQSRQGPAHDVYATAITMFYLSTPPRVRLFDDAADWKDIPQNELLTFLSTKEETKMNGSSETVHAGDENREKNEEAALAVPIPNLVNQSPVSKTVDDTKKDKKENFVCPDCGEGFCIHRPENRGSNHTAQTANGMRSKLEFQKAVADERKNLEAWFCAKHKNMLNYRRIVNSPQMVSFLEMCTLLKAEKRLGGSKAHNYTEELKQHDWFAMLDWDALLSREIKSPLHFNRRRASVQSGALDLDQDINKGRRKSISEQSAAKIDQVQYSEEQLAEMFSSIKYQRTL